VILGEINSALTIFERLRTWFGKKPEVPGHPVATRFVKLFEAHGVHRNQLPRVFGHGLTLSSVVDDAALLTSLTGGMLDRAAELFCVRRTWLEGASEQIYPLHDFYKQPKEAGAFLHSLRARSEDVRGVVLIATPTQHEESALVILEECVGAIDDDRPLYRYHLCNNWLFPYWKSRAFLAAFVAAAWRNKIHLLGRKTSIDIIRKFREGTRLLEYEFDGALPTEGTFWYPEDMLVKPASFLEGLDEGAFGKREAIKMWLGLEDAGLLSIDLPYAGVRKQFEAARALIKD
jgi:hypothetical protein